MNISLNQWGILASIAIGGAAGFWTIHQNDPMSSKFWIGMLFATLSPIGTYLGGLFQNKPGNGGGK